MHVLFVSLHELCIPAISSPFAVPAHGGSTASDGNEVATASGEVVSQVQQQTTVKSNNLNKYQIQSLQKQVRIL